MNCNLGASSIASIFQTGVDFVDSVRLVAVHSFITIHGELLLGPFLKRLLSKFIDDDTTTMAASLAFYTAFSLAPLVILFVTVSAELSDQLQTTFISQMRELVGPQAADGVEMVISHTQRADIHSFASVLGFVTLLISASLIFGQLRTTLNKIFAVKGEDMNKETTGHLVWNYLRDRILHVGLALSFIFALIISLVASTLISAIIHTDALMPMMLLNFFVSILFYLMLFTLLFRYLPDQRLPWKRALQGGALTAILFDLGKELIGIYLGNSAIGSAYGAAGSVIVLLVWVYYSALITFVGAQVSYLLHLGPEDSEPS